MPKAKKSETSKAAKKSKASKTPNKKTDAKKEKKEMGRPSVYLDERVRNTIIVALKMGLSRDDACNLAGVSPSGFWMFVDRMEKNLAANKRVPEVFRNFLSEIKKARSELKIRLLRKIDEAAERNWQAAAWRLERGFPDEFGRKFNEARVSVDKSSDKVIVEIRIPDELKLD